MIRRLIIYGLGTSIIQIIACYFLFLIISKVADLLDPTLDSFIHGSIAWAATVIFTLFIFIILVTTQNCLTSIFQRKWLDLASSVLFPAILVLFYFLTHDLNASLNEFPIRCIFLIAAGITCFVLKQPIDKMLNKKYYT